MTSTLTKPDAWNPDGDYVEPITTVLAKLETDPKAGLRFEQAKERLAADGPNSFGKTNQLSVFKLIFNQFASSVVLLLIVAASISAMLREYLQTAGITAAIFINAIIGFITEYQSHESLEKLAALTEPTVRVRRNGQEHAISTTDLVRGDVVVLQAGDRVPADLRLVSMGAVCLDESILTGESVSVNKTREAIDHAHDSILFQGTCVSSGRATGVVVATGTRTRLGRLSITIQQLDTTNTPLEMQLDALGRKLTILTVALCIAFAIIGILQGTSLLVMIETSIALAVAAIPEGLPVVATLSLALGIQRMVKQKALVRRLPAVEALGSASVICTDKTGTLTQNKMLVTDFVSCFQRLKFGGHAYEPTGAIEDNDDPNKPVDRTLLQQMLLTAVLCNDARLENHDGSWHIHGDPTEGALLAAAAKAQLDQPILLRTHPRVAELAFDLSRKRMSTANQTDDGLIEVHCKGSPESVLSVCSYVLEGTGRIPIEEKHREWIIEQNRWLSGRGLRVLALAHRKIAKIPACLDPENLEVDLTFMGLIAMYDPAKPEVNAALAECRSAGIRVIMLTGDQAPTAYAIGKQLGICASENELISGEHLQNLSDQELCERLKTAAVFARVTPESKLVLVQTLQRLGEVVAMTGDGVNDAPALKQADIGVAMGEAGSDLARDAASLVITDDNFATIVHAIAEGRQIYNKIRSAIGYLLSASVASLAVTGLGVFLHEGLLLTPLQLLWLNLIMHVFPCIGLVAQQNWDDLMTAPPRPKAEPLLDKALMIKIGVRSGVVTAITLAAAAIDRHAYDSAHQTAATLTAISGSLILLSWTWLRSVDPQQSIWKRISQYKPMLINTVISYALIFMALYVPALNGVLQTTPLPPQELATILGLTLLSYVPFIRFSKKSTDIG